MKKIIIAILLILIPKTSYSLANIKIKYEDYYVKGRNIRQINKQIRSLGPKSPDGRTFAALTLYKFAWDYEFDKTKDGCTLKSMDTNLQITYQMPQLEQSSLTDKIRAKWNDYITRLKKHEDGHVNRVINAATEIDKMMKDAKITEQNCQRVKEIADDMAKEILRKHHNEQISYDDETNHGLTQGAKLSG